MQIRHPRFRLG